MTKSQETTGAPTPMLGKAEGDISSVFPSLSGKAFEPLPARFLDLKRQLLDGKEEVLRASWERLLQALPHEIAKIKEQGSKSIPSINYADIQSGKVDRAQLHQIRRCGAVVIRGVVPEQEALDFKSKTREYIAANQDRVKAFPKENPAVYELYWSPSQAEARAHSNVLEAQKFLLGLWHSSDSQSQLSLTHPLTYADRLRIRNPGDTKFTLGPHSDGGSLERWEDSEYRRCYAKILDGRWEDYDPFDAKHRVTANQDLYNGAGACSMLRCFQGWLSMSSTGSGEGTLRICPLLQQATAYLILRPLMVGGNDSSFPGSVQGAAQEYNDASHPDLNLAETMISIPRVEPGDFVAWHCDTIHSVDKEHIGKSDSSVMYIPAVPLTEANARSLQAQRENASLLSPPPDMPGAGGVGERGFSGHIDWNAVSQDGLRAMGMGKLPWMTEPYMAKGELEIIAKANKIVFAEAYMVSQTSLESEATFV